MNKHYENVRAMMKAFGQEVKDRPEVPSRRIMADRLALIFEEFEELCNACGLQLALIEGGTVCFQDVHYVDFDEPDLTEMADAMADIQVVNTGFAVACGIDLPSVVAIVDENNMKKVSGGRLCEKTGKFLKPVGHQPPDIKAELDRQAAMDRMV